jgi:hypothetical protein
VKEGTKSIAAKSCIYTTNIEAVIIPEGVRGIGQSAFQYVSKLNSITLPDSLVYIAKWAFSNTGYYNTSANWENDKVLYIGNHLIYVKSSIPEEYTIRDGTKCIASSAFGSYSATLANLPEGITGIGDNAFYCILNSTLTIPSTVEYLGTDALFSENMKTINICDGNINYFTTDGISFDKDITRLIKYNYDKTETEYIVPDTVYIIDRGAFAYCSSLTSIILPEYLSKIGSNTFFECSNLKSINLPDTIRFIESSAFENCKSLKEITLPSTLEEISSNAFSGCSSLTSVNIPDSVTEISSDAFYKCSALTKVNITDINAWCNIDFSNATANPLLYAKNLYLNDQLITNITIPEGLTKIYDYVFRYCTSLTSVTIPDSVTSIGEEAFKGCSNLETIVLPDTITSLGPGAFINTSYYNNESNWENNVLYIGNNIIDIDTANFSGELNIKEGAKCVADKFAMQCKGMTSITFPNSMINIGREAFWNCLNVTKVVFSNNIKSIGYNAFAYCYGLKDVYYSGTEEEWAAISIGSGNDYIKNATIHYNYTGE